MKNGKVFLIFYVVVVFQALEHQKLFEIEHSFIEDVVLENKTLTVYAKIWRKLDTETKYCRTEFDETFLSAKETSPSSVFDSTNKAFLYTQKFDFEQTALATAEKAYTTLRVVCADFGFSKSVRFFLQTTENRPVFFLKDFARSYAKGEKIILRPQLSKKLPFDLQAKFVFSASTDSKNVVLHSGELRGDSVEFDPVDTKTVDGVFGHITVALEVPEAFKTTKVLYTVKHPVVYGGSTVGSFFLFSDGKETDSLAFVGARTRRLFLAHRGKQLAAHRNYRLRTLDPSCISLYSDDEPFAESTNELRFNKTESVQSFSVSVDSSECFNNDRSTSVLLVDWLDSTKKVQVQKVALTGLRVPSLDAALFLHEGVTKQLRNNTVYFGEVRFSRPPFAGFGDGLPKGRLRLRLLPVDDNVRVFPAFFDLVETTFLQESFYHPPFLFSFVLLEPKDTDLQFQLTADAVSTVHKDKVWLARNPTIEKMTVQERSPTVAVRCPVRVLPNSYFECSVISDSLLPFRRADQDLVLKLDTDKTAVVPLSSAELRFVSTTNSPFALKQTFRLKSPAVAGTQTLSFAKTGTATVDYATENGDTAVVEVVTTILAKKAVLVAGVEKMAVEKFAYGDSIEDIQVTAGAEVADVVVHISSSDPVVLATPTRLLLSSQKKTGFFSLHIRRDCAQTASCFAKEVQINFELLTAEVELSKTTTGTFTYKSLIPHKDGQSFVPKSAPYFPPQSFTLAIEAMPATEEPDFFAFNEIYYNYVLKRNPFAYLLSLFSSFSHEKNSRVSSRSLFLVSMSVFLVLLVIFVSLYCYKKSRKSIFVLEDINPLKIEEEIYR